MSPRPEDRHDPAPVFGASSFGEIEDFEIVDVEAPVALIEARPRSLRAVADMPIIPPQTPLESRQRLQMKLTADQVKVRLFPETEAGGFTSLDGTIEFYDRVNALIFPAMNVLDFGAGRAAWYENDTSSYRRGLRNLRGKAAKVVGCDIDSAVKKNPAVDEAVVIDRHARLPFEDEQFDLVLANFVFEHIDDPLFVASELDRVLKHGGWICARTPNKYGYVSLLTRIIRNRHHVRLLRLVQPDREKVDVFPTRFRMNTKRQIRRAFPSQRFHNYTYHYEAEPGYFFNNVGVFLLMMLVNKVMPRRLYSSLFIFLRKR